MTDSIAPQIITGLFTLAGVAIALAFAALESRRTRKHEDKVRFHANRLQAAEELINAAQAYRRAILAISVVSDARADGVARPEWARKLQEQFEAYQVGRTRFDLVFPASVRATVEGLAEALNALRVAAGPGRNLDVENAAARQEIERVTQACREWIDTTD